MNFIGFFRSAKVLSFIGGVAAATVGIKILKSDIVRKGVVKVLAKGMKVQQDAMSAFEAMKEEAQDLCYEAQQQAGGAGEANGSADA
ncbi:MAG: DUF1490 domain-containing protein [Peptococcaceae bacterium]|jgi:hypothetical protein|nr:DUF1490 domain-containing protein [Peptococcaceae bacterium]